MGVGVGMEVGVGGWWGSGAGGTCKEDSAEGGGHTEKGGEEDKYGEGGRERGAESRDG